MKYRMSTFAVIVCATATSLLQSQGVFAQGSLTPPGAPAPTMKTLSQIEPRTPISSLPFTISTSGSYYLTGNLSLGSASDGITVSADDVAIDLNGFVLSGPGGVNSAIHAAAAHLDISVVNGTVRNWGAGVNLPLAINGVYRDLLLYGNTNGAGLMVADN